MSDFDAPYHNPDQAKQVDSYVRDLLNRDKGNTSITSGAPFTPPDQSGITRTPTSSSGAGAPAITAPSLPAATGAGSVQSAQGGSTVTTTEVIEPRVVSGLRVILGRNNPDDNNEARNKLMIEEGIALFLDGTEFLCKNTTTEEVDLRNPNRFPEIWKTATTTQAGNNYFYVLGQRDVNGNLLNSNGTYTADTWIHLYITKVGVEVQDSSVSGNISPAENVSGDRIFLATLFIPANTSPHGSMLFDRRRKEVTWADLMEHERRGMKKYEVPDSGPRDPDEDWKNGNYAHREIFERKDAENDQKYVRASVPTVEPLPVNEAPGVRGGNGIKPSIVTVNGYPTLQIDLDITHTIDGQTTDPRTGTLVFDYNNATGAGLSLSQNLPAYCTNKYVVLVVEGNSTSRPASPERNGVTQAVTVRLPKDYTVGSGGSSNVQHTHEYEDVEEDGTPVTKETEPATINIPTAGSVTEAAVTGTVTVRWFLLN